MPKELKQQIKEFWDKLPCGTGGIQYPEGTIEYYEAISRNRYAKEYFIDSFVEFEKWNGKKVLEIGCGAGSDFVRFAQNGAMITGIDLSTKSVELTNKRLSLYKLKGEVLEADAENMPFADNTYDVVVSIGVLHHTPDMQKAINEVYRVLKPNGEIRIMLYHKPSIVCLQMWVLYGVLKGKPFRNIDDIFYNYHESIGTKVLTIRDAEQLFGQFRDLRVKPIVTLHDIRYARNKYLIRWFMNIIPDKLGWNILISGRK